MDIDKLIQRVKAILLTPKSEWPVIAAESSTVADIFRNHVVILAAIPAVFGFIKGSVIGYSLLGATVRASFFGGIGAAILTWLLTLASVYLLALIVDALAPSFAGEKNIVQAIKLVAYAYTANWVASAAVVIPVLGGLIMLAAMGYGIYLLYLGLPHTMKSPPDRAVGYTAVTVVIALVLGFVMAAIVGGIAGTGALLGGAASSRLGHDGQVTFDKDSKLGRLAEYGSRLDAAGKRLDEAGKSGDAAAAATAATAMLGAVLGGGDKIQALPPGDLKAFVPQTLAGLGRTEFAAEQSGAMGMQISSANATYRGDDGQTLRLTITDVGSAKALLGLASVVGTHSEKETDTGYEKTFRDNGRLVHEQWDRDSKHGEYTIVIGERFTVAVEGNSDDIATIRDAVASLDLDGLEALRGKGVSR